jgi:hypothetical protein
MNAQNPAWSGPTILVSGDLTNDHYVYTGERYDALDLHSRGVVRKTTPGGVALLFQLLKELFSKPGGSVAQQHVWSKLDFPNAGRAETCWEGYAMWEPCAAVDSQGKIIEKEKCWRCIRALGYGEQADCETTSFGIQKSLPGKPDVIVLDDLGLDFRRGTSQDRKSSELWPRFGDGGARQPWIVLKMSAPVAQGDLWWELIRNHADQLVVVTSAEDLRVAPARISRGSSWERTVEDVSRELTSHPILKELARCRHLVVRFGNEGVYWRARGTADGSFQVSLVFDSQRIEGEWTEDLVQSGIDGRVFGAKTTLTASVVWRLAQSGSPSSADINLMPGLKAGLDAIRCLQREGHGKVGYMDPVPNAPAGKQFLIEPGFPYGAVAETIRSGGKGIASLRLPVHRSDHWSFLGPGGDVNALRRRANAIAVLVARRGMGALENIPYGRFGVLQSVDRNEIEQYRAVRQLMLDYVGRRRHVAAGESAKPLALGVFGPPGAGKSFGVKQIAKIVLGKEKPLEFNLSQFKDQEDLLGAFHQVRDRALQGSVPLVFWDEFDAREFFWLQYFLAPIQDGKFQQGQVTHWIGHSIFVFAGGTSETWDRFGDGPPDISPEEQTRWQQKFRLCKGPDFKSRISGFLNVLGPNRRKSFGEAMPATKEGLSDVCCPIRRALLLRSMLELKDGERWEGDPGLLSAMLDVSGFRHGARSLEKIVQQLRERGGKNPNRDHLPSLEVLSMHLESASDFLRLCDRALPFQNEAEKLGRAYHEYWCALGDKNRSHQEYGRDFDKLPADVKADNYAAARRIPEILALAGLALASKDALEPLNAKKVEAFLRENLELLAETEHDGWMVQKLINGWRFGKGSDGKQDRAKRLHPSLVPYAELSEADKQKDRENVLRIPEIVESANFSIVPTGFEDLEG